MMPPKESAQDKAKEISFFDRFTAENSVENGYNVFTEDTNQKIVNTCIEFGGFKKGARLADFGCGSGIFTEYFAAAGYDCTGMDLHPGLIARAQKPGAKAKYIVGDVENAPFESNSLDGVILSALIHHLPDPARCASEVYRVLKPGGSFVAFDPNRLNPIMWLYRDKSSPFYSNVGVTENERPVIASHVRKVFSDAGFQVSSHYVSGLKFSFVESTKVRWLLPLYNFIDENLFKPKLFRPFCSFVFTKGTKA